MNLSPADSHPRAFEKIEGLQRCHKCHPTRKLRRRPRALRRRIPAGRSPSRSSPSHAYRRRAAHLPLPIPRPVETATASRPSLPQLLLPAARQREMRRPPRPMAPHPVQLRRVELLPVGLLPVGLLPVDLHPPGPRPPDRPAYRPSRNSKAALWAASFRKWER
jgi:hypothetical protein